MGVNTEYAQSSGKVKAEQKAGLAYDSQYADAVTRWGGLTEDGKKATLRPGDFEKLDELCRELGVHARFADGGEVLGGAGNASISGREIVVARDHQGRCGRCWGMS